MHLLIFSLVDKNYFFGTIFFDKLYKYQIVHGIYDWEEPAIIYK